MKLKNNIHSPIVLQNLTEDETLVKYAVRNHTSKNDFLFDMHYELELGIVISGKIERIYNNYRTVLSPGMVWLNSMWEPHGYSLQETPCKLVMFFFKPELLFNLDLGFKHRLFWFEPFTKSPETRPQLPKHLVPDILDGIEKIDRLEKIKATTLDINIRLLLMEILSILNSKLPQTNHPKSKSNGYIKIQPAIELLFSKRISITDQAAATACKMSRRTFTEKFKKIMHISYAKFCMQYRLRQASIQLRNGNEKITKIAFDNGFSDVSHFYRCFNQYYKCSPANYRKQQLSND